MAILRSGLPPRSDTEGLVGANQVYGQVRSVPHLSNLAMEGQLGEVPASSEAMGSSVSKVRSFAYSRGRTRMLSTLIARHGRGPINVGARLKTPRATCDLTSVCAFCD